MKLEYCLKRKTMKCNTLVQKFICFFKKRHHAAKAALRWVPRDPNAIFLVTTFTWKIPESSDSMHFPFFMLENVISSFYLKWTELTRYCELCSNCESPVTRTDLLKIHNLLWIRSTLGKMMVSYVWWYNDGYIIALKWRNTWNLSFLAFFE